MASVPRWAWIAAGIPVVLAAPLAFIDPRPPASGARSLTAREEERVAVLVQMVRGGQMLEARRQVNSSLERGYALQALPLVLQALLAWHQQHGVTRDSLFLYGELLAPLVLENALNQDFEYHLRRLRHNALVAGGKEPLAEITDPFMRSPALADYSRNSRRVIVQHAILFGRWEEVFAAFQKLPLDEFRARPFRVNAALRPVRTLVRIASAGQISEARTLLSTLLQEKGESLLGPTRTQKEQTRHWLRGIEALYRPGAELDWGSRHFEAAVDPQNVSPSQVLFRLDLAEALRQEAARREQILRDEFLPYQGGGLRQVFTLGWGAVRLRDQRELAETIALLAADPRGHSGVKYQRLLLGAQEIFKGLPEVGSRRIRDALLQSVDPLSPEEVRTFQALADGAAVEVPSHPSEILFTNGRIWAELRRDAWVDDTLNRLKAQIASPRDLTYVKFLESLRAFRSDDLQKARAGFLSLLEEGSLPPGLTRGEIASLLVLTEARQSDLTAISSRLTSTTKTTSGRRSISFIPSRDFR